MEIEEKPIEKVEKYQRFDRDKKPQRPVRPEKAKTERREEPDEAPLQTELKPFTDETKKAVADKGVAYITKLLDCMDVSATVKSGETESGATIMLEGDNLGVIVGRRGETLDDTSASYRSRRKSRRRRILPHHSQHRKLP